MTREQIIREIDFVDFAIQSRFNDCSEMTHRALQEAIKLIKQEPCEDAVSRKAVHNMLEDIPIVDTDKWFNWLQKACLRLADLPSVTPVRKKGHWIMTNDYLTAAYETIDYVKCSYCGEESLEEGDYCPNCGAEMQEVEE